MIMIMIIMIMMIKMIMMIMIMMMMMMLRVMLMIMIMITLMRVDDVNKVSMKMKNTKAVRVMQYGDARKTLMGYNLPSFRTPPASRRVS